eukprot:CAMPEP_0204594916 /NCGR_PEP_ID=MMETSP0661-20131031/52359_1 /ASSEMBLY_ACC=CAM_ASM_000606 /TAXON_ID=109239 /ORGANISM="Alexandrium margalefi, Strain AMGDE01CS-322" /LENGTH=291 /DNA_ID=CAMNT_0051605373 /DNA_START=72 /DNA_END=947 /DNA_ORIENTATION=-
MHGNPSAALLVALGSVTHAVTIVVDRERGSVGHFTYEGDLERNAATRCFAGYVNYASDRNLSLLEAVCPSWRQWVTTDGTSPNKVHAAGTAVVLGHREGSAEKGFYGSIRDGGVDVGCGFNCDLAVGGKSNGVHLLSIPVRWFSDCCSETNNSVAHAIAQRRTSEVCPMLRDGIRGGLEHAGEYTLLDQATTTGDAQLLSQCYHMKPEVWTLHLHTTAGAITVQGTPWVGLGPQPYNACVCEPSSLGGRCPVAQPREAAYVREAAQSLCFNVARAGKVPQQDADAVCGACL